MYLNFNDPKTGLIYAVTGKIIYNSIVNVEKSYEPRKKLQQFESSLPGGYHNAISRIIIKMDAAKKGIGKAEEKDFRPRVFHTRVLALRLVNQEFYFKQILSFSYVHSLHHYLKRKMFCVESN